MHDSLISTQGLVKNLDSNWLIIDCRFSLQDVDWGRTEFQKAHIPGAVYAHLNEDLSGQIIAGVSGRHPLPKKEDFTGLLEMWGIEPDQQVVAYDQGPGMFAARIWWMLRWAGHEKVAVLDGGWNYWAGASLPLSDEMSVRRRSDFKPVWQDKMMVEVAYLEERSTDSSILLIDARDAIRYRGEEEPIDPVAGHIPGAVNRPWKENMSKQGMWKSELELRNRFIPLLDELGRDEIIMYCGSGVTGCHNVLAFYHAGLGSAKLYPGSWSEWITDPGRKIGT